MPALLFFYDYVDPASWLAELEIAAAESELGVEVERHPFELRPPPAPLVDARAPEWLDRWREAGAAADARGLALARPRLVPWTRKAHELALHAREHGRFAEVHRALWEAFLLQGRDVGRVDVLLDVATAHGLDLTETKAVLDVDRHAPAVAEGRKDAERAGIQGVPTLLAGPARLEGLQAPGTILASLRTAVAR